MKKFVIETVGNSKENVNSVNASEIDFYAENNSFVIPTPTRSPLVTRMYRFDCQKNQFDKIKRMFKHPEVTQIELTVDNGVITSIDYEPKSSMMLVF